MINQIEPNKTNSPFPNSYDPDKDSTQGNLQKSFQNLDSQVANLRATPNSINPTETAKTSSSMKMSMNTTETLPKKHYQIDTEDESTLIAMRDKGVGYEYINNQGNNGKLGKLTTDANGNVESATHALVGPALGAYVIEGDPPPPPPAVMPGRSSSGWGDPHFTTLHGVASEFQGTPGNVYNLLSDADVQFNALFQDSGGGTTTMGQAAVRIGKDNLIVNPGGSVTLNGNAFSGTAHLKGGTVSSSGGNASISTKEYGINIINQGGYLDIAAGTTAEGVNRDEVMPSGILVTGGSESLRVSDGILGTGFGANKFGAKTKIDKLKDSILQKYNLT